MTLYTSRAGEGPNTSASTRNVQKIVQHFHEAGKPIFTICHGAQVLMAVKGVLTGKACRGARILRT